MDVEYMVMRKTDGKWSSPVCFTLPADEAGDDERVSIKRRAEQRGRAWFVIVISVVIISSTATSVLGLVLGETLQKFSLHGVHRLAHADLVQPADERDPRLQQRRALVPVVLVCVLRRQDLLLLPVRGLELARLQESQRREDAEARRGAAGQPSEDPRFVEDRRAGFLVNLAVVVVQRHQEVVRLLGRQAHDVQPLAVLPPLVEQAGQQHVPLEVEKRVVLEQVVEGRG